MESYKNKQGNSGVVAFEVRGEAIHVKFMDGTIYVYNTKKPGKQHVQKMIRLAREGKGLSTYISQVVRERYYEKVEG